MLFGEKENFKAVEYPFNWAVEYNDGTCQSEFDRFSNKKNDFYMIQQDKIDKFGLIGQGYEFYYDNDGGFYLNGRQFDVEYHLDGDVYELTKNEKRDCITYKQAYSMYANRRGDGISGIDSIDFGYKTNLLYNDLQLYFQCLVKIPLSGVVSIEVKMTSNRSVHGELVFKDSNGIIDTLIAPLDINKTGIVNWTVK